MKHLARWLRSLSDYLDPASRPALHTYEPWGACDLAELAAREVDEHLKSEELAERNRAYRSTVVRPESTWETRPVGDGWMEMVGPENEGGLTVRFKPWPAS